MGVADVSLSTAYDIGDGNFDTDSPSTYASRLAKSITDPSTIYAHTMNYYGRAPSVNTIRGMIKGHQGKGQIRQDRGGKPAKYNEDYDDGHWAVRVTDKKRQRDYLHIPPPPPTNPFLKRWQLARSISESVGEAFGVPSAHIMGKQRTRKVTHPRSIVYKLLLEWGLAYAEIGRRMGDRDHSTIIHGATNTFHVAMRDEKAKAIYERHKALMAEAIEAMKEQEARDGQAVEG